LQETVRPSRSSVDSGAANPAAATAAAGIAPLAAYLVAFFATWTAWVIWLYPRLLLLGNRTLIYAVANLSTRLLIWVVPVFLYIRHVDGRDPVAYLKLRDRWQRGIGIGLLVGILNLVGTIARFGLPHPTLQSLSWNSVIGTSLLVGFIEEVPFRGLIFQKLGEQMKPAAANALSSLLFVAIHLPGWISLGTLRAANVVTIFVIGVVLAAIFRWSGSLWSAIVAHSSNDFVSFVLFGLS